MRKEFSEEQERIMMAMYELALIEAKNTGNKPTDVHLWSDDVEKRVEQDRHLPIQDIATRVHKMVLDYEVP